MLSRIRGHLTYANVAMTLALVFAMSGGAYAAKHYLITSTKQISPKVLKALKGKNGTNGLTGAVGPAGAAGKDGTNGTNGKDGAPGTPGLEGKEGSPWTLGGTLPKGKTLKGEWSISSIGTHEAVTSVSFALPLKKAPEAHYIYAGDAPAAGSGCKGTLEKPEAEEGKLCVFAHYEENSLKSELGVAVPTICAWESSTTAPEYCLSPPNASPFGFGMEAFAESNTARMLLNGTWAVTGN